MTDIFLPKSIRKTVVYTLAILTSLVTSFAVPGGPEVKTLVGNGWHPWYEVKVDPENPKNLIICGTKWDARQNAPFGFVYNSGDGGRTWRTPLEDRHSGWVTEHSCAFGPGHAGYFISEAAAMVNGSTHHELGTSRLYVSTDAGNHWSEAIRTGWADYSTSAVSLPGGSLYTFFNADTNEASRNWGASVGLLRFSPDGKRVDGPFLNSEMKHVGYEGAFPSDAITLKSGRVVALYWATRQRSTGREADLGIVRANASPEPHLDYREISQTVIGSDCINFDTGSLAYDPDLNRLSVLYVHGCTETRLMLTMSDDEGSTWTKSLPLSDPLGSSRKVSSPSLAVLAPGILGLLWEDGETSGRWLFSYIRNSELVLPPAELSCSSKNFEVSNDALWTSIHQAEAPNRSEDDQPSQSSITINVRTGLNSVWRTRGLAMAGNQVLGIWPSKERDGMRLYSQVLTAPGEPEANAGCSDSDQSRETDVTDRIRLLYGGIQQFDSETKNLKVCLALRNESDRPIRTPIMIDVQGLSSPLGTVSALNGANIPGADASWDISSAITGNQVPPGMSTNPFCLSFHIDLPEKSMRRPKGVDLLTGKMKVYAETSDSPSRNK